VEVKLLSIAVDKARDMGADWGLFFGRDAAGNPLFSVDLGGGSVPPNNAGGASGVGGNGFPPNTTVFGSIAAGVVGGFTYSSFGYFLRDFQVSGRIAYLKQNNRLYDLSQPTVITKSGVPVTISSLTEEPIQNFTEGLQSTNVNTTGTLANTSALSTTVQTFKYGILLDVLATELRNGNVDLIVTPRLSAKIGTKGSGVNELPIIQANTTTTTVTVPPGRTVAMGGVLALNETRAIRETPGLSKIPLIGKYLFSRQARTLNRTNVIILVTPRIIRPNNSPAVEASCDEQHFLDLAKSYGSRIIGAKKESGVIRRPSVDPADPNDPYDLECREPAGPATDGKSIINRHN
jgi:type II secretory pathway component GspD/PulD (secretin)